MTMAVPMLAMISRSSRNTPRRTGGFVAGAGDVAGGVVEHRLGQPYSRNRRDEGDQEERPEQLRDPAQLRRWDRAVVVHGVLGSTAVHILRPRGFRSARVSRRASGSQLGVSGDRRRRPVLRMADVVAPLDDIA